jgi:hypothetical protein
MLGMEFNIIYQAIPSKAGIHVFWFPVFKGRSLGSRWSLPRTCQLDPTPGYGAGMTKFM